MSNAASGWIAHALAATVGAMGHHVLGIDMDADLVQRHADSLTHVVQGDAAPLDIERDFGVTVTDLHRPMIDELTRPNPDDPTGRSMMRRVPEVLDCWFESGSMPFAQVHYPFASADWFEHHYPGDFIVEYNGQTRGWFYTLHVLATALFDGMRAGDSSMVRSVFHPQIRMVTSFRNREGVPQVSVENDNLQFTNETSLPQRVISDEGLFDSGAIPPGGGFIVRTNALEQTKTSLNRDFAALMRLWKRIETDAARGYHAVGHGMIGARVDLRLQIGEGAGLERCLGADAAGQAEALGRIEQVVGAVIGQAAGQRPDEEGAQVRRFDRTQVFLVRLAVCMIFIQHVRCTCFNLRLQNSKP